MRYLLTPKPSLLCKGLHNKYTFCASGSTISSYRSPRIFMCVCDYYYGRGGKKPDPNAKSIVTNALPLISRNSFSPTSCQRTTRHSKDYAASQRHLVETFRYPSFTITAEFSYRYIQKAFPIAIRVTANLITSK